MRSLSLSSDYSYLFFGTYEIYALLLQGLNYLFGWLCKWNVFSSFLSLNLQQLHPVLSTLTISSNNRRESASHLYRRNHVHYNLYKHIQYQGIFRYMMFLFYTNLLTNLLFAINIHKFENYKGCRTAPISSVS